MRGRAARPTRARATGLPPCSSFGQKNPFRPGRILTHARRLLSVRDFGAQRANSSHPVQVWPAPAPGTSCERSPPGGASVRGRSLGQLTRPSDILIDPPPVSPLPNLRVLQSGGRLEPHGRASHHPPRPRAPGNALHGNQLGINLRIKEKRKQMAQQQGAYAATLIYSR